MTNKSLRFFYNLKKKWSFFMKVKIFDESHEKDLENDINDFLDDDINVIDIKYQVAIMYDNREQIYCYSAMIIYE